MDRVLPSLATTAKRNPHLPACQTPTLGKPEQALLRGKLQAGKGCGSPCGKGKNPVFSHKIKKSKSESIYSEECLKFTKDASILWSDQGHILMPMTELVRFSSYFMMIQLLHIFTCVHDKSCSDSHGIGTIELASSKIQGILFPMSRPCGIRFNHQHFHF